MHRVASCVAKRESLVGESPTVSDLYMILMSCMIFFLQQVYWYISKMCAYYDLFCMYVAVAGESW